MELQEFCKVRNLKPNTVSVYIRNHKAEFEGHTSKKNKKTVLDEVAIKLLEKKYPLATQIELVQDSTKLLELHEKIEKLQEVVIQLQSENAKLAIENNRILLLEEELSSYQPTIFGLYRKK